MYECIKENKAIVAAIKYGMALYGVSPAQMALAMRENPATYFRRMKHPEDFTLDELRKVSAKIHIPIEKLVKGEIQ